MPQNAFYWLPYRDEGWHTDMVARTALGDIILPFLDGADASRSKWGGGKGRAGQWSEIRDGDELWLPVHGRKWTTEKASWATDTGLISWSADEFADQLLQQLLWKYSYTLHYHLLACFGANNILHFAKSLGARLADAMSRRGFQGTLTAYKGATGMAAHRGTQVGKSRVTAAPWFLMHRGPGAPSHITAATQDAAATWPLGIRVR